ncbi:MAG: hypothetical protein GY854_01465 [Deltaproteobacteria bacterium]|nr:hypothetical protein [Deltaproteobacteria bacterium]
MTPNSHLSSGSRLGMGLPQALDQDAEPQQLLDSEVGPAGRGDDEGIGWPGRSSAPAQRPSLGGRPPWGGESVQ